MIKMNRFKPSVNVQKHNMLSKNPFLKKISGSRTEDKPLSAFVKYKISDSRVPFKNSRLVQLASASESLSPVKSKPVRQVYGFYNVSSNQSGDCSFNELSSPFIKDKNLEDLNIQPFEVNDLLELKEITNQCIDDGNPPKLKVFSVRKSGLADNKMSSQRESSVESQKSKRKADKKRLIKIGSRKESIKTKYNKYLF